MKTRHYCLWAYLICAVLTFGAVCSHPGFQRELAKAKTPEETIPHIQGLLWACAFWPLWWSGRFFQWVKSESSN